MGEDEQGEQQERARRIKKRFVLRAAQVGEDPLRWSYCTIHNLSATGILFTYDRPVDIGTLLYLRIDFPERLVECVGRVVRFAGNDLGKILDLGAQFIRITDGDRQYIEKFVAEYRQR